jgi:phage gpG-like protein
MLRITSTADRVIAAYQLRLARSKDLTVPLTKAGDLSVAAAKLRFNNNDWAPNSPLTIAIKGSSRPGINTGNLRANIVADQATATSIRVGTSVKYAAFLQKGRGPVYPVKAKALHFGGYFFKHVGPSPPRPFLYFDDPLKAKIRAAFLAWLNKKAA